MGKARREEEAAALRMARAHFDELRRVCGPVCSVAPEAAVDALCREEALRNTDLITLGPYSTHVALATALQLQFASNSTGERVQIQRMAKGFRPAVAQSARTAAQDAVRSMRPRPQHRPLAHIRRSLAPRPRRCSISAATSTPPPHPRVRPLAASEPSACSPPRP